MIVIENALTGWKSEKVDINQWGYISIEDLIHKMGFRVTENGNVFLKDTLVAENMNDLSIVDTDETNIKHSIKEESTNKFSKESVLEFN